MTTIRLPYGRGEQHISSDCLGRVDLLLPPEVCPHPDPSGEVRRALEQPIGSTRLDNWHQARRVAIAVLDKTRPAVNHVLLPPLLIALRQLGIPDSRIDLLIASGTHPRLQPADYPDVLPMDQLGRCRITCHDADDQANLADLGQTSLGTPIWINRRFVEAELRIVLGILAPHQFMGFSGGVKGAAIGLAGRETIERNHARMTHPAAQLGRYADNPARQEVEEIGSRIPVDFVVDAVLNREARLAAAIAGEPRAVMGLGIGACQQVSCVSVRSRWGLVIASAGGHPRDVDLYQAQKALAHASMVTRPGGTIILVAACPQGAGSADYEAFMEGMESWEQVMARFETQGFKLGFHKAYQISRDARQHPVILVSQMDPGRVRRLLLQPARDLEAAVAMLPAGARWGRVGVMPWASATIPLVDEHEST